MRLIILTSHRSHGHTYDGYRQGSSGLVSTALLKLKRYACLVVTGLSSVFNSIPLFQDLEQSSRKSTEVNEMLPEFVHAVSGAE